MRLWKRLQATLPVLSITILVYAFIAFITYIGVMYYTAVFPNPDWTGFGTPELNKDGQAVAKFKTLWDWLGLLLVPLVLAIGGFFLTRSENRYALALEQRREKETHKIEERRAQDAALQTYLDHMTELLLHEYLRISQPDNEVRSVARARTLTVLRVLDSARKAMVLQFLYDARLIGGIKQEAGGAFGTIETIVKLEGANLEKVNLQGANLEKVNLQRANLQGARLEAANLKGANLKGANLMFAVLTAGYLEGAHLEGAALGAANLNQAQLEGSHLNKALLIKALLIKAQLFGANLTEANLVGADLTEANLTKANLVEADLTEANLAKANLVEADLTEANLQEASLYGADLREANLDSANLQGARLQRDGFLEADLSGANLQGATMPDGSKHE